MADAPERIRVAQDADGFWTCREAVSGSQEYVRADLYAALEAQLAAFLKELSGIPGELVDRVAAAIRDWGSHYDDGPWESLSDERKEGWRSDARRALAAIKDYLTPAPVVPAPEAQHTDDKAVDRFAAAMKRKLAQKREEGRGGWDDPEQCSAQYLSNLLRDHVEKGDPLDVGNLAMMLHQRGERISPAPEAQQEHEHIEVTDAGLLQFAEWFRRNYPGPDTIIHKPDWHAPKIYRAARHAFRQQEPEAQQEIPSGYGEYTPITVKSSTASFTRPAEQAVTEAIVEAVQRIRETAMRQSIVARIPECGEFGGIAQDADWLLDTLKAAMEAKG